jgi:sugar transferase (PEP-CTERM/EpsH1 system associated)
MKRHLLFLVHRIPYPPNKGDKIRSFHLLKYLSNDYQIHLATFIDRPEDWIYRPAVQDYITTSWFGRLTPGLAKMRSLKGLLTKQPLSLPYYYDANLTHWLVDTWRRYSIHAIFVYSSAMAQYVLRPPFDQVPRIIDFVDVDSAKWHQYSLKQHFPYNWIYAREAHYLSQFERQIADSFTSSLFVSEPEAALFKQGLCDSVAERVHFMRNGVDIDYFSVCSERVSPFNQCEIPIVFTGAMDYWANSDGAQWFVHEVLPLLREKHPQIQFYIVGMNPSDRVLQLARQPNVTVTGSVQDVRPYLQHARVVVVPLQIARGIQNKILEAMAMQCTVVTTTHALEGITARSGHEIYVADTARDFATQVLTCLSQQGHETGCAARDLVIRDWGWASSLPKLGALLT